MKPLFVVVKCRVKDDQGIHGIYEHLCDAIAQAHMLAVNDADDYHDYEVRRQWLNTATPVTLTKKGNFPIAEVMHTENKKYYQNKHSEIAA